MAACSLEDVEPGTGDALALTWVPAVADLTVVVAPRLEAAVVDNGPAATDFLPAALVLLVLVLTLDAAAACATPEVLDFGVAADVTLEAVLDFVSRTDVAPRALVEWAAFTFFLSAIAVVSLF